MTTPHDYGKDSVFPPRVVFTGAEQVIARRKASKQARMERQLANMSTELRELLTSPMPGESAFPTKPLAAVSKPDPWVVVGTTTIDGTFEQVREAFGETWENVDHLSYALARGDQWNIGGRHLVVHSHEVFDGGVLVSFDIVRRQFEIDAEQLSASMIAEGASTDVATTGVRNFIKALNQQCPECGPHGNRGRVALNFIEVACTTCAGGVPGDAFGRVAQDGVDDGPELTGDESVDVYGWECS